MGATAAPARRWPGRAAALAAVLLAAATAPAAGAAGTPERLLVLPFELVDSSLEGEVYGRDEAQTARLAATTRAVRQQLAEAPGFRVLPEAAAGELYERERRRYAFLYRCVPCLLDIGRAAGSDLVLVGWVQKVSNLILNMSIRVYDVDREALVRSGWISLRGNTDAMWRRAADRLVERVLLEAPEKEAAPGAG